MCGIVAYIGSKNATPILINGLKRLEYRGYDSFGFAVINKQNKINYFKKPGRIGDQKTEISEVDLSGDLGLAHCLHPNTFIQLDDGIIAKVKNLNPHGNVFSLSSKKLDFVRAKARGFRHQTPPILYKVKTNSALINCSANHGLLVFEGGKIIEKKAKKLKRGDLLICAKKISVKGKKLTFDTVPAKRYYTVTPEGYEMIKGLIENCGLFQKDLAKKIGITKSYLDHIWRNDRNVCEDQLKKFCHFFSLKIDQKYFVPVHSRHGKFIKLSKESSVELMQIFGYFLGDGHAAKRCIRFKDQDREILVTYKKLIKKVFNLEGRLVKIPEVDAYLLEVNSKYLADWLRKNVLSRKENFLSSVGQLPKQEIAGFLRGLFDAEGCVGLGSGQLTIRMTDEDIVRVSQFLFLRFGILPSYSIASRQQKNWNDLHSLAISNYEDVKVFSKEIGFSPSDKATKLIFCLRI